MQIIGHRGSAGTAPENTLLSFEKAITAGVNMIELDVHRCQSGELIVLHDEKINRTTNGKGAVNRKTLEQLEQFDAGQGEKIPTLREVLNLVNRRVKINIELKGAATAIPVVQLLEEYKNRFGWQTGDFCISSFDHRQLLQFRQLDPLTPIGILYEGYPKGFVSMAQKLQAASINIPLRKATRKTIDIIHAHQLEVWVYTVNRPEDFLRLKQLGADAVFTNFPEKMLRLNT